VLYISFHRYDEGKFFPGKGGGVMNFGNSNSTSKGKNLNMPFDPKWGKDYKSPGDDEYIYAFERLVVPVLKSFQPELVLVSAGFDSMKGDPIGKFSLTTKGYKYMTRRLMELSLDERVIVCLEGGYNPKQIAFASEAVLKV